MGLQPVDELVLSGLLGATLSWKDPDPVLHSTPYWMLKHLGLNTGGYQYAGLRESLLRLGVQPRKQTWRVAKRMANSR
jgi:plasmid replication initiation protein